MTEQEKLKRLRAIEPNNDLVNFHAIAEKDPELFRELGGYDPKNGLLDEEGNPDYFLDGVHWMISENRWSILGFQTLYK